MDPVLRAVLTSWNWRLEIILVLALAGTLYSRGWWRLRKRTHHRHKVHRAGQPWPLTAVWRFISYLAGLVILGIALMSPIDVLGGQLFFMHMIQHLLLIMIVPPLLLIANPMAVVLWGLPDGARRKIGGGISVALHRDSYLRQLIRAVTAPGLVWLVWVIVVIGWHDPNMYNWALRSDFVHDLEHLSFFLVSMVYWWHVTGAGPRIHKQFGLLGRIIFVVAAIPPNMLTGIVLAFADSPIYTYYLAVPRIWNISVMTDQRVSGVVMWIPGSMMYIIAALILIGQLLDQEERKPSLPEKKWATDDALLAPGLKK
ncbi:MAG: cytochrome c oxidase assembly protein [Ardenticatenaceae bacterium]|nr:cytochrome c oxidase assembly protein [Ardenticatenaceae bacterium]